MIKLVALRTDGPSILELSFSDGTFGRWSAQPLIARATVLTIPLADPEYFGRAFIESGALAWPNGLELSPAALHAELSAGGGLSQRAA